MDEIYGYLPPTANPPSKKPMMILLKQARAFGLGLLLATQNPVDLDYKALSNIGTWWLGRLQTERDKMRVLDGLEGAISGQGASFDRGDIEAILSGLGNRVFLMNNVHEDHPVVMNVRWAMTYLRGPVSRQEIKKLMDPVRPKAKVEAASEDDGFAPPGAKAASEVRNTTKPKLPDGVSEYFYPVAAGADESSLCYQPALIRSALVNFDDARKKISGRSSITLFNEIDSENQKVNWNKFYEVPKELDLAKLGDNAESDAAEYADLPSAAMKAKTYDTIAKDYIDWVYANHSVDLSYCPLLETYSNPGENTGDFRARMAQTAREQRDAAVEEMKAKFGKKIKGMEDDLTRAMTKVDTQKAQASSAKLSTAIQIGSSLLGALFGRKGGAASLLKTTTVSSASRAWREGQDVSAAEADLERLKAEYEALNKQCEEEVQKLQSQYDPAALVLETSKLSPVKKNISVAATGIVWMPFERVGSSLKQAWA
jgi:hypothetical protein